ncbi:MAG: hypothetical protein IJ811_02460, partial [Clostridia bacterium]|nr:hypothetical protein [Clostridia bacterium]
ITIDGEEVTPEWRQSQKFWIARKKFINITEMNTAITARIHADADGEATENDQTVTYSISSYVAAKGSSE